MALAALAAAVTGGNTEGMELCSGSRQAAVEVAAAAAAT
jgi:hypothetical protein